jgi:ATP-dependent Clp protease ATP-binding subunit ClpX
MDRTRHQLQNSLYCSFCGKSAEKAGQLLSSPNQHPRVYICDECVASCSAIIEDDRAEASPAAPPHPFLAHPLASELMRAIEQWLGEETSGDGGSRALSDLRTVANRVRFECREQPS